MSESNDASSPSNLPELNSESPLDSYVTPDISNIQPSLHESQEQEDIKEQLAELGITIEPIDKNTEFMVQRRDSHNVGRYSNLSIADMIYKDGIQRRGLFIDGRIVGFATSGLNETDGKRVGEVAMVHISEPLRGMGLGSLLNYMARLDFLDLNPDILSDMIGDQSGKIEHILKQLGFSYKGQGSYHPNWQKDISDPTIKEEYKQKLKTLARERIQSLADKKDELKKKTEEADYDNPSFVSIEKTVEERLKKWGPRIINDIFGYQNGKIFIRKEHTDRDGDYKKGTSIEINLPTKDQEKIFGILTKAGLELKTKIRPIKNFLGEIVSEEKYGELEYNDETYLVRRRHEHIEIYSPFTKDEELIAKNITNIAGIAQKMFDTENNKSEL